jgi:glycerol-3-phosphate dehydrogenase
MERLRDQSDFDLVVIGGGIVGAGIALDAASRGMTVALFERSDYAGGTSSRSTKLFHGGIRYMAQYRFGLVREGLREQKIIERTADYLYEPLEFVIPLFRDRGFGDVPRWVRHPRVIPIALRLGLWLYDALGGRRVRRHRTLSRDEVLRMAPRLRPAGLRGGFAYWDAQTDDARLTLAVVRTAVAHGAVTLNWSEVTAVAARDGGFTVAIHDRLSATDRTVSARAVVAATGAFAAPPLDGSAAPIGVVSSSGAHLIAELDDVGLSDRALALPETDDGRVLYLIPWRGRALIGTTDMPYHGAVAHPRPSSSEVAYLERHLDQYLELDELRPVSSFSGLRSLAVKPGQSTARASRRVKIAAAAPGYLLVAGGKLTGYRVIAARVTDRIGRHIGKRTGGRTRDLLLAGTGADPEAIAARAAEVGFDPEFGRVLYRRYGSEAAAVLDLATDPEMRRMLGNGHAATAEVVHAVRHECAVTVADFALRRTRLAWFTADHGRSDAALIAFVMAGELGWSEAETADAVAAYEEELVREGL